MTVFAENHHRGNEFVASSCSFAYSLIMGVRQGREREPWQALRLLNIGLALLNLASMAAARDPLQTSAGGQLQTMQKVVKQGGHLGQCMGGVKWLEHVHRAGACCPAHVRVPVQPGTGRRRRAREGGGRGGSALKAARRARIIV